MDLGNSVLPVSYAYTPGKEEDGVTVQVPLPVAEHLTSGQIQWMVPGLREEQINVLLRALPKVVRRQLMPIDPKVREIAREFDPGRGDFLEALARFIGIKYRVEVKASDWPAQSIPAHLQPRVEVVDQKKQTVITARDLETIKATVKKQEVKSDAWDRMVRSVERYALSSWSFGDLPESLVVEEINGTPVLGYPGLMLRDGEVDVRLFRKKEEAVRSSPPAIRKLAEAALGKDIAWLWKELRNLGGGSVYKAPANFQAALSSFDLTGTKPTPLESGDLLQQQAQEHILQHALRLEPVLPLTTKRFNQLCENVRKELPTYAHKVRDLVKQVQDLKQKLLQSPKKYPGMEKDVARLTPPGLLAKTPHQQLLQLPRFLKAIQVRAERASINPAKDADKADLIADYDNWERYVAEADHETFRWMLEEYRVSVFAQELGTAQPVSAKRLEAMMS